MVSLKDRLLELLIKDKLLTQEQLDQAIEAQQKKGGSLCAILADLRFIKKETLASILSKSLGLPLIDLKRFKIDPETAKIIPGSVASHYLIVPVSKIGDTVTVAMADPLNIFAIDHLQALTSRKVNPIISSEPDILQAIELAYPDEAKGALEGLFKEIAASSIELIKEEKEVLPSVQELDRSSREAPVVQVANMIVQEAVAKKSSDILIEPFEKTIRLRFRIDGILHEQKAFVKNMFAAIVSRIKVMSELNIAEHRLPQDGRFKARVASREVDFRVSILPSSFGEKVAIRILDKSQATLDIDKLGFSPDAAEKLKKTVKLPHGMILVCGPTGSGKTTTLYSLLKFVDSPDKNIVTVEDPVEFQLEGINQVTARPQIGLTFASALRSILRQDPNIIMIGEIRDFDTVDIAIKSALTGHLVLSTLHTTTASGAVVRLTNMGVEPYLINSSLLCVMAQRLLRKLCLRCKEEYAPKKEIMESLKLSSSAGSPVRIFRAKGCKECFNLGYSGRVGIAEILLLTPAIRNLILNHAEEYLIKEQARKEGMRTLREEGMGLVFAGETTLEEVLRVTAADE